jgi:hypothetical protein
MNQNQFFNPIMGNQNFSAPPQQITWVNGYEEVKKFQVPRKSNAVLFDSEIEGRFYIKVTDDIGMYNIRFFDYKEVFPNVTSSQQQQEEGTSNYITYDQLTSILSTFKDSIVNELKEGKNEHTVSTTQSQPYILKQQQ